MFQVWDIFWVFNYFLGFGLLDWFLKTILSWQTSLLCIDQYQYHSQIYFLHRLCHAKYDFFLLYSFLYNISKMPPTKGRVKKKQQIIHILWISVLHPHQGPAFPHFLISSVPSLGFHFYLVIMFVIVIEKLNRQSSLFLADPYQCNSTNTQYLPDMPKLS